jgi:hypothetical protein
MDTSLTKRPWLDDIIIGLSYYFFTSLIVVLGVMFGREFVKPPPQRANYQMPKDFLASFSPWDGLHYKSIVERGYFYDPERRSNVAFFPAYPMLGRLIVEATGMRTEAALLIVSHTFLAGAFILLRTYTRLRFPDKGPQMWDTTLLAFGVFPTTFFFRMTYTESMFVFLTIVALLGMERKWPVLLIALICGLATATRPVGVALIPPFLLHLWHRSETWRSFAWQSALLLPVSAWGLLGYMAYQDAVFDEPLAFAKTQEQWHVGALADLPAKATSLLTLDPVVGVYDPASPRYWARHEFHGNPAVSLIFANGVYFCFMAITVLLAAAFGWLNFTETQVAAWLIMLPYFTRAHEMSMGAFGRFAATIVPAYFALGLLLARGHAGWSQSLAALGTALLAIYAALYASGYLLY